MPRWIWFTPLGVLVAAIAVWGFRLGWIAATISETDVIEVWTEQYVAGQVACLVRTFQFGHQLSNQI